MQFGHLIRNFQLFSINHAHILLSSLQLNTDNWVTATLGDRLNVVTYALQPSYTRILLSCRRSEKTQCICTSGSWWGSGTLGCRNPARALQISKEVFLTCKEYKVLVRVQCHDAMITNEINLFGLARVEDGYKTQKDLSSSWLSQHDTGRGPEHFSRYLCNFKFMEINKLSENMVWNWHR